MLIVKLKEKVPSWIKLLPGDVVVVRVGDVVESVAFVVVDSVGDVESVGFVVVDWVSFVEGEGVVISVVIVEVCDVVVVIFLKKVR